MKCRPKTKILAPIVSVATILVAWILVVASGNVSPLIVPSPQSVLAAVFGQFWHLLWHSGITLAEAFAGFCLGGAAGFGLAMAFALFEPLRRALYPLAIVLKAVPLIAIAPLVVTWFGGGFGSKAVLAALMSFFPILVATIDGLEQVDKDAVEMMRSLSATKWDILFRLKFPSGIPSLFSGLKVASTLSVVGAVVAEFVNASSGIGYLVKSSSYYLDTHITFAAIGFAGLSGLLFFGLVSLAQRIATPWESDRKKRT